MAISNKAIIQILSILPTSPLVTKRIEVSSFLLQHFQFISITSQLWLNYNFQTQFIQFLQFLYKKEFTNSMY